MKPGTGPFCGQKEDLLGDQIAEASSGSGGGEGLEEKRKMLKKQVDFL